MRLIANFLNDNKTFYEYDIDLCTDIKSPLLPRVQVRTVRLTNGQTNFKQALTISFV